MSRQAPTPFEVAIERGQALVDLNRHAEAIRYFQDAAREDPDSYDPWCRISHCWYVLEDAPRALEFAREAGRRGPDEEWPHRLEAASHLLEGDLTEAYTSALRAARIAPELAMAIHLLGICAFERGRLAEAAELGRRTMRLEPEGCDGPLLLARIAVESGEPRKARSLFEQALRNDPTNVTAMAGLASLHERSDEHVESLDLLQMALREDPSDKSRQKHLQKALFELFVRGSRDQRWRSLGAGVTAVMTVFIGLALILKRVDALDAWRAEWGQTAMMFGLPIVVVLQHGFAIMNIHHAIPTATRSILDASLADIKSRGLRIGLWVVSLLFGAACLHAWSAGSLEVFSGWFGIPLMILALGVWLWAIILPLCFLLVLVIDALRSGFDRLAAIAPDPIESSDVMAGIGLALVAGALIAGALADPDDTAASVVASSVVVAGVIAAVLGFQVRSRVGTATGCVVLGGAAVFPPILDPDVSMTVATFAVCGGVCLAAGVIVIPWHFLQKLAQRHERVRLDRVLEIPNERRSILGIAQMSPRRAGGLKIAVGVIGTYLVFVTFADVETHSARLTLGKVMPGAVALIGVLEVATGRSLRSLSRPWDRLSPRRQLVIGAATIAATLAIAVGSIAFPR